MQRNIVIWIIALILVAVVSVAGTTLYIIATPKKNLVVSTTTSLYDTELLDTIEDKFEAKYPTIDIYFVPVGTGIAILHGQRGDADMILVHAPSEELTFLKEGYGVCRKIVAYNFFAIVGPEADPANIEGLPPLQALSNIAATGRNKGAKWVSRGDESGTHMKEKSLWTAAGFNLSTLRDESWYIEAGGGMGGTLQVADYFDAYTLTDMGTYLRYYKDGLISLEALVTEGEELLNVYSAIAVNKTRHSHVNFEGAITFIKFLISKEGQQIIANFGKDAYGQSLFYSAVNAGSTVVQWIKNYAFFNGYECPPEYWDGHRELYE